MIAVAGFMLTVWALVLFAFALLAAKVAEYHIALLFLLVTAGFGYCSLRTLGAI